MPFPNKFTLSVDAQRNLILQNLVQLVYTTGKFERLQTTLLDTESIINNETNTNVRPDDIVTVINLKRGYQYILNLADKLDFNHILILNNIIQGGIPAGGKLRTEAVQVPLTNDVWLPPLPNEDKVQNDLATLFNSGKSATEQAIDLNLYLSKRQLFNNGNKRTAIVAANALMIQDNAGMLAIPENKMHWYRSQLAKYYRSNRDIQIKQWLYDECIFGIN